MNVEFMILNDWNAILLNCVIYCHPIVFSRLAFFSESMKNDFLNQLNLKRFFSLYQFSTFFPSHTNLCLSNADLLSNKAMLNALGRKATLIKYLCSFHCTALVFICTVHVSMRIASSNSDELTRIINCSPTFIFFASLSLKAKSVFYNL